MSTIITAGSGATTAPTDWNIFTGRLRRVDYDNAKGKYAADRSIGSYRGRTGDPIIMWNPLTDPRYVPRTWLLTRDAAATSDSNYPHSAPTSWPFVGVDTVNRLEVVLDPDAGTHGVNRYVIHSLVKKTDTLDAYSTLRHECGGLFGKFSPSASVSYDLEMFQTYTYVGGIRFPAGLRALNNDFQFAFAQTHCNPAPSDWSPDVTGGNSIIFNSGNGTANNATLKLLVSNNAVSPWRDYAVHPEDWSFNYPTITTLTQDLTWYEVVHQFRLDYRTPANGGTGFNKVWLRKGPGQPITLAYDSGYVQNGMIHQSGYGYFCKDGGYFYNSDSGHANAPAQTEIWHTVPVWFKGLVDATTAFSYIDQT